MPTSDQTILDVSTYFEQATPELSLQSISTMARGLVGSEILRIAANVRTLVAQGQAVCNFTVGDFAPAQFPIPEALRDAAIEAYGAGRTNYPPSEGIASLRKAIVQMYEERLGLRYPVDTVQITSGARPGLYATYAALIDPGETVVYPVPSWNNDHYAHLVGAKAVEVPTRPEDGFLPTAAMLAPHLRDARLLSINSPLNPAGTMISPDELKRICDLVLAENTRRKASGDRLLYMLYDQIYWDLQFGAVRHVTPVEVAPEMAAYTIFVDGISKAWAATGIRVGWMIGPPHIINRAKAFLTHVGAWAPHPEQEATANVMSSAGALDDFTATMHHEVQERLNLLYSGVQELKAAGLPVDAIAPQGAIYLSVKFDLIGRTLVGQLITKNSQIGDLLLDQAGVAVVPFQAFGLKEETGWMRFSVGAVSLADVAGALPRMRAILERVQ
jgi:aspartate aminotransferase